MSDRSFGAAPTPSLPRARGRRHDLSSPSASRAGEGGAGVSATNGLARRAALLAVAAVALTACGRRGEPEAPAGADPLFPRQYPSR